MLALLKYNYRLYKKHNKFLVPLLIFLLIQKFYYSEGPIDFAASMVACANVVFGIMAWMGFSYCELQDSRTEQIVYLKVKNHNVYWISKVLFMWIIGIILSLIGVAWPLITNLLRRGNSFENSVNLNCVLLIFFIQILVALTGILLGMIFQTKIIGSRDKAIIFIILAVLLSIVKGPLLKEFPFAKLFAWILPPIYDVINAAMKDGGVSLRILGILIIYTVGYIFIQIFIYIKIMKKKLF